MKHMNEVQEVLYKTERKPWDYSTPSDARIRYEIEDVKKQIQRLERRRKYLEDMLIPKLLCDELRG